MGRAESAIFLSKKVRFVVSGRSLCDQGILRAHKQKRTFAFRCFSTLKREPPTEVRVWGNRLAQHVPEQTKEVASDYPLGLHRPASLDREAF